MGDILSCLQDFKKEMKNATDEMRTNSEETKTKIAETNKKMENLDVKMEEIKIDMIAKDSKFEDKFKAMDNQTTTNRRRSQKVRGTKIKDIEMEAN